MIFPSNWLDANGLVMPQPSDKPSDNGVLFTSVAKILGFNIPDYKEKIRSCYLKTGLVARWPKNNFYQSAWDDYMAVAVASIKFGITDIPREILWYGLKHAFFYNTDKKLEGKDFLGRNIPIWPMMLCAAFPKLKYLFYPYVWIVTKFQSEPNLNDTSGFQLQWLYLLGAKELGFNFEGYDKHEKLRAEAFLIYYHKEHPFNVMNKGTEERK